MAKQIILNEAQPGTDREELEQDINKAYRLAQETSLRDQLRRIKDKWGHPIEVGLQWLDGDNTRVIELLQKCM